MDVYIMLQEIPKEENGLINEANGLSFEEYKEWLKVKYVESGQTGIVDGWKVPSTTYWLYVDENPVGFGSIRHFLTDALREAGGNIGYGIAPKHRGKGYGKEILGHLLKEASRLGIDSALVTIHLDNVASKAAALVNGGVITGQTDERILIWIDRYRTKKLRIHLLMIFLIPVYRTIKLLHREYFSEKGEKFKKRY